MAFNINQFKQISAGDGAAISGKEKRLFSYLSEPDTLSDVLGDNYFGELAKMVVPGDGIRLATTSVAEDLIVRDLIVSEVDPVGDIVSVKTSDFAISGELVEGNYKIMVIPFNDQAPPAPLVFTDNFRIIDAFIRNNVASVLTGTELALLINGDTLCTFDIPGSTVNVKISPVTQTMDTSLMDVVAGDTFAWVSSTPANTGEGYIYLFGAYVS